MDTKYEFGRYEDKIYLIDEIHTPDSSRFFYQEGYGERQARGEAHRQLSKEFVRLWLIDHGFQGKPGQVVPEMTDEWLAAISERYIELYEVVTGQEFVQTGYEAVLDRIDRSIRENISAISRSYSN